MKEKIQRNITWSEIRTFIYFGSVIVAIVLAWGQMDAHIGLVSQKVDSISSSEDSLAKKEEDLANTQQSMAKELVRIGTIIDINQKDGKLSDSQTKTYTIAYPSSFIATTSGGLTFNNFYSGESARPTFSPQATPTPVPTPTQKKSLGNNIRGILSPIVN